MHIETEQAVKTGDRVWRSLAVSKSNNATWERLEQVLDMTSAEFGAALSGEWMD